MPGSVSLTGKDVVTLNGRVFHDFAHNDIAKLAYAEDLVKVEAAKDGNVVYGLNEKGKQATLELRHRKVPARVLVLTQYDDKEYAFHMIKAGASGYVVKKAAAAELVSAIRAVRAGESFLYPSVARAFIDRYVRREGQEDASDLGQLSDREKQVLKLLAEGRSNREIADLLCLSVKTVMSHRAAIMERLDIHNRTDLVKFAIRAGLVQVER